MPDNSSNNSLLDRILSKPDNLSGENARIFLVCKIGFPLGLFYHSVILVLFWYLSLWPLVYFNLVSVVGWSTGIYLLNVHHKIRLTYVALALVEMPLHAILATLSIGLGPGFFYWVLIPVTTVLLAPFLAWNVRIIISGFLIILFVVLAATAVVIEPWHELPASWQLFFVIFSATGTAFSVAVFIAIYQWAAVTAEAKLAVEFDRAEGLLRNILPDEIAAKLKDSPELIADEHKQVSILFADIVDFTETSSKLTPAELIENLNRVFSRFDDLVAKYDVEKIKTIGDAYMVVAGLPNARKDHAIVMTSLALDMLDAAREINEDGDIPLQIRIGINSGPVVAGVIGHKKFAYDLWGDTVNVAARMEELGEPGRIQITQDTRELLGNAFECRDLGKIAVKGKGKLQTYSVASDNRSHAQ